MTDITEGGKYYTPSIEELHVGLEIERLREKAINELVWCKETFSYNSDEEEFDSAIELFTIGKGIRVKRLDNEDIIEEGWEAQIIPNVFTEDEPLESGYTIPVDADTSFNMFYLPQINVCQIYKQQVYNTYSGNWTAEIKFNGKIANRSELRRIMKQVGII